MTNEPEPTYYATITFAGQQLELLRSQWKEKRTAFTRWYARYDGQSEQGFHDTRSDSPGEALGTALLLLPENDAVAHRVWGLA